MQHANGNNNIQIDGDGNIINPPKPKIIRCSERSCRKKNRCDRYVFFIMLAPWIAFLAWTWYELVYKHHIGMQKEDLLIVLAAIGAWMTAIASIWRFEIFVPSFCRENMYLSLLPPRKILVGKVPIDIVDLVRIEFVPLESGAAIRLFTTKHNGPITSVCFDRSEAESMFACLKDAIG